MQPAIQQQLSELFNKSKRILIALPKGANVDSVGSALALAAFLKKFEKHVDIFSEKEAAEALSFLPGIDQIKQASALPEMFVITVDTSQIKVEEFSYESGADALRIYLTPSGGNFKSEQISSSSLPEKYDAIVCLGVPSLESLGDLYTKNTAVFFGTPKINVDHHINNENYGNVNAVDVIAVSTSEIVFEFLQTYNAGRIDADIATALLAGIISETNSFQSPSTTPKSFRDASELVNIGARQQEIVTHLFKTRKFSMLKLLGRAMARIKALNIPGVVFSVLTAQDIEKSQGNPEDLEIAAQELIKNIPDLKLFFLAVENKTAIELYIYTGPNIKLAEIVNHFGGEQTSDIFGKAKIENQPLTAIEPLLNTAIEKLKPRLGL